MWPNGWLVASANHSNLLSFNAVPQYQFRMNLTREQAAAVAKEVGPMLGYKVRLRRRMEKVGFLPGDPLYRLMREAEDKLHALSVELHYRSCAGGVGRLDGG